MNLYLTSMVAATVSSAAPSSLAFLTIASITARCAA